MFITTDMSKSDDIPDPPENILSNLNIAVFSMDRDFKLVYFNSQFEAFIQTVFEIFTETDMTSDQFIIPSFLEEWNACTHQAMKGLSGKYEIQIKAVNGAKYWIELSTNSIFDGKKINGITGTIQNIDERKLGEGNLRTALEKEIEINRIKSKFIRVATHQFKTPLTIIKSNVELIAGTAMRFDKKNDKFEENINLFKRRIYKEIDRIVFLMDDVLQSERAPMIEDTVLELNDIQEVCDELVNNFNTLKPKGRILEYEITGKPIKMRFNIELMQHALFNLIDNAFKYSNTEVNPKLELKFQTKGTLITIQDKGIGIPKSDINDLFTPFFRGSNTKGINGTGLGLNIAHQYLRKNKAEIKVESVKGEGTKFIIRMKK